MKHCTDPAGEWPDASADVSSDRMNGFLAHAEECAYHGEILNGEFEQELRSAFRLARGLDDQGRILRGAELRNTIAKHEGRAKEWKAVGCAESPFGLISLYNGGRLIAGSGAFHNYTYHRALHDLDPRAGLQVRARCARDKDEDVLLGFYPLSGVRHDGEEVRLPLDNFYTVGLKVEQIAGSSFEVHFRCFEEGVVESARVYVSNEPLRGECTDDVKLLILEIRHLAGRQRYEEALSLARRATEIAPGYWRAQINLGTLLVMSGEVDGGEKIFRQVSEDCSDNPRAVAAGLHCRAWLKEMRCGPDISADDRREVARLYEEALRLDGSLANTRACLLFSLTPDETDGDGKLLEDSVLCEGFFDALQFEFTERGAAKARNFLHALPARFRNLFLPIGPSYAEGY